MAYSSDVRMNFVYQPLFIAMVIAIVQMVLMKRIVLVSHVPTTNSCVPKEDRTVLRNVFQNHNYAIIKGTVRMEPMKSLLVVSIFYFYSVGYSLHY